MEEQQPQEILIPLGPIVTSGESDAIEEEEEEDFNHHDGLPVRPDDLYDEDADKDDEEYVYRNLRSGTEQTAAKSTATNKVLKPRNSDAVLSCPCCFHTLTMDCQQHERYPNQYRAMFVMNVVVKWEQKLVHRHKGLVALEAADHKIPPDPSSSDGEHVYYTVCCANCQTQVAALDMEDEVYHFYGCRASS